jgi:ubiquinone/menaquinone biosynthesis C-methylase UbiE
MKSVRKFLLMDDHTCPWWLIGSFDNPLRRLIHPPERILAGLVKEGQTVLDLGPGMGYFTLPLARMVGPQGTVIAADLQPQMLAGLRRRAERAGLLAQIQCHMARPERIGVSSAVDFALAFWMLHEVQNPEAFLSEVRGILKPGAQLLLVEPILHVAEKQFNHEVAIAVRQGFEGSKGPTVRFSRSVLLTKPR